MKIIANRFYIISIYFLGISIGLATPNPPAPTQKGPPPPPPLPVDEHASFLLVIALIFGIYMIYKYRLKTKAPI